MTDPETMIAWMDRRLWCSISDCGKPHYAKGFCGAHYRRLRKHGDPLGGGTPNGEPMRFINEIVLKHTGEGCLTWPFSKVGKQGRGKLNVGGKTCIASRYVCELAHGEPPTAEHEAAHSCGKGHLGCVAPGHLSWKTSKENKADMLIHGTRSRGESHGQAKLTEVVVIQIMAMKGIESQRKTAKRFGVSHGAVAEIHQLRNWAWLTDNRSVADEVAL